MTVVFDRPVLANGFGKLFAFQILAENILTNFFSHLVAPTMHADHHPDGLNARPVFEHHFALWNLSHIVVTFDLTVTALFHCLKSMTAAFEPVAVFPVVIGK